MSEEVKNEPLLVPYDEAVKNFKTAFQKLEKSYPKELEGKQEALERYLFSFDSDPLWVRASEDETIMPLSRLKQVNYGPNGPKKKSARADVLKKELDAIRYSIDAFCEEGEARDEILTALSHLYGKKLRESCGLNDDSCRRDDLITLLRSVIVENRDALIDAVSVRGRPVNKDLIVDWLLRIFEKVLPDMPVSTGEESLCYKFILVVLQSCAPDEDLPNRDKISVTLGNRIKNRKKASPLMVYNSEKDIFEITSDLAHNTPDHPGLGLDQLCAYSESQTTPSKGA